MGRVKAKSREPYHWPPARRFGYGQPSTTYVAIKTKQFVAWKREIRGAGRPCRFGSASPVLLPIRVGVFAGE